MSPSRSARLRTVTTTGHELNDAIIVEPLVKRYANGTDAVRGISFRMRSGEGSASSARTAPASRRR
jgi:hypothetical protein